MKAIASSRESRRTVHQQRSSWSAVVIVAAVCLTLIVEAMSQTQRIDADLVKLVASEETHAGRLRLGSDTCLGFEKGNDVPERLLNQVKAKGLKFRRASACRQPPNGVLLAMGPLIQLGVDKLRLQVEVIDMTINEDSHFATLLSRGFYILGKGGEKPWVVLSYDAVELK